MKNNRLQGKSYLLLVAGIVFCVALGVGGMYFSSLRKAAAASLPQTALNFPGSYKLQSLGNATAGHMSALYGTDASSQDIISYFDKALLGKGWKIGKFTGASNQTSIDNATPVEIRRYTAGRQTFRLLIARPPKHVGGSIIDTGRRTMLITSLSSAN